MNIDVSIIVPVLNEESNLPILHKQIAAVLDSLSAYEIIYVDDGSTDKSFQVLQGLKACDEKVKIIQFDKNYGQTSALDAGLKNAKGDFILTIDADLAYDVKDLLRIAKELESCDAVIGYRYNRREADGFIKYISSKAANFIRNKVLRENFKDAGCFLRGFRKICLGQLVLYSGFQVFMMSLLRLQGCRIKEIPVKAYPRKYGRSKYGIGNRLFKELYALFIVKYYKRNSMRYRIKECA